jgi:hypothetical protein
VPVPKKQRTDDPTLALLETLIDTAPGETEADIDVLTPFQVVKNEIECYQNITREQWPKFEETIEWWNSKYTRENLPCLIQVAGAILACQPSSGGLECDFGLLKDVIGSRRASLGQGYVEIEMMLCLNKKLLLSNPERVVKLPNDMWNNCIPMRLTIEELDRENDTEDNDVDVDNDGEEDNNGMINVEVEDTSTLSSSGSDKEDSFGEFDAEEYEHIVTKTQQPVTETQVSTHRVFDSQETMVPGSLH